MESEARKKIICTEGFWRLANFLILGNQQSDMHGNGVEEGRGGNIYSTSDGDMNMGTDASPTDGCLILIP